MPATLTLYLLILENIHDKSLVAALQISWYSTPLGSVNVNEALHEEWHVMVGAEQSLVRQGSAPYLLMLHQTCC